MFISWESTQLEIETQMSFILLDTVGRHDKQVITVQSPLKDI